MKLICNWVGCAGGCRRVNVASVTEGRGGRTQKFQGSVTPPLRNSFKCYVTKLRLYFSTRVVKRELMLSTSSLSLLRTSRLPRAVLAPPAWMALQSSWRGMAGHSKYQNIRHRKGEPPLPPVSPHASYLRHAPTQLGEHKSPTRGYCTS